MIQSPRFGYPLCICFAWLCSVATSTISACIESMQRLHILQVGDANYLQSFIVATDSFRRLAITHNFSYHQHVLVADIEDCIYTQKVIAIREYLYSLPMGHWLMYSDADNFYVNGSLFNLFTKNLVSKCDFIAQDSVTQINSGIVFVKNSKLGRYLMDRWMRKQMQYHPCRRHTSADQVTLQDAVLETAFSAYRKENCLRVCKYEGCLNDCAGLNCTPTNSASAFDWSKGVPFSLLSNMCYGSVWDGSGRFVDNRSTNRVCLLPRAKRLNVHDYDLYQKGDLFFTPFHHLSQNILKGKGLDEQSTSFIKSFVTNQKLTEGESLTSAQEYGLRAVRDHNELLSYFGRSRLGGVVQRRNASSYVNTGELLLQGGS
jgi:hypothetical protein